MQSHLNRLLSPRSFQEPINETRSESSANLHVPSNNPSRAQSTTDLSDPAIRATMLDAMLGDELQSDDEDTSASASRYHLDDIGDAHGDPMSSDSRDELEYLRCVRRRNMESLPQHSSVIKFSQHQGFLRYGQEEHEAIKHFEFLNDFLSDSERTVTDGESSEADEQGPEHESSSWCSVEKTEMSSTPSLITNRSPSPKQSLSSEHIAQILNGSCMRLSPVGQPSISEKKVSKMSARVEHASSLTTVVDNVHCGADNRVISRIRSSFAQRSTSKSPSPQQSYDELYYGVTIRDNQAAQRLSLAALGKKAPEFTPVNRPEAPRQSSSTSTLL